MNLPTVPITVPMGTDRLGIAAPVLVIMSLTLGLCGTFFDIYFFWGGRDIIGGGKFPRLQSNTLGSTHGLGGQKRVKQTVTFVKLW